MHYYSHNIKEFRAGCHNLESRLERWIYRDMIDVYYDREEPFPDDLTAICAMLGLRREAEKEIVSGLLLLKFELTERGWENERCEEELVAYRGKLFTASEAGKASAAAKKLAKEAKFVANSLTEAQRPFNDRSTVVEDQSNDRSTEINALRTNQEPRTKNQEPKEPKSKAEARASRLPSDWHPTDADAEFCRTERPDLRPSLVASRFFDYWIAQPGSKGRKSDWSATWRNWVRNEKLQPGSRASPGQQQDLAAAQRASNDEAKRRLGILQTNDKERIIDAHE